MDNPETLITLDTQDIERRQSKRNKRHNITQKTKKITNTGPTSKPDVNPGGHDVLDTSMRK